MVSQWGYTENYVNDIIIGSIHYSLGRQSETAIISLTVLTDFLLSTAE
jgi:hypothetical protein